MSEILSNGLLSKLNAKLQIPNYDCGIGMLPYKMPAVTCT